MKKTIALLLLTFFFCGARSQSGGTESPAAPGEPNFGVHFSPAHTSFVIWSPDASAVKLRLYAAGEGGEPLQTVDLQKGEEGIWRADVLSNVENDYYTVEACIDGKWLLECPDPYAKAVGVNGHRGMIVDLQKTNPEGWASDRRPSQTNFTDIIIYEAHVRDLSISPSSGITHKGKFLGLAETGTHNPAGASTGLDHIKELGVTHIHLMPSFDFNSIDEKYPDAKYNWGYDPVNYNVPEGSYATDAYDGRVRIKELKKLIQTLHANGLRVILDVVYNHTSDIAHSNFTQLAPGYFYRHKADGSYSDATGCGNETASEQPLMRQFMVASVAGWANDYHVDGFRFDLMGVHDLQTMQAISDTLHKIDPTIFIYGEGWAAGASPLPESQRAVKKNVGRLNGVAAFSDDIRDGLRGGINDVRENGFASGRPGTAESIKFGIVASTQHDDIDYQKVCDSKAPWATEPYQVISYVSCHDDNCLFDRLRISNPNASEQQLIQLDKFASAVVLTAQGVPFILAGDELLRTKKGVANSFNSPDSINELDWTRKTTYAGVYDYYRGLIALRRHHPAFRMPTTEMIQKHLKFLNTNGDDLLVAYQLTDHANGDICKNILIILNASRETKNFDLPKGLWSKVVDDQQVNEAGISKAIKGQVQLGASSINVFFER